MAFLDKLNRFATVAGEKAGNAIEIGRLNLRLGSEERKIEDATFRMGGSLLLSLDEGNSYDETIMTLFEEVKAARASAAALREEITLLSGLVSCPSCLEKNTLGSNFCRACGTALPVKEAEPFFDIEVEVVPTLCPNCSHPVDGIEHYCTKCGVKLD